MSNLNEFGLGDQATVESLGGEFLAGSGFEREIPDADYGEADDSAEVVRR